MSSFNKEERKVAGIEFSWPIEPQYQPLIHDFYYCDIGESEILGFTHNNGKLQKRLNTTLVTNVRHRAFDINIAPSKPIFPAAPGRVQEVWNRTGKDQRITIVHKGEHGVKVFTEYWHLGDIFVKKGDVVDLTTVIANSGFSGGVRIPHLHFSIRVGKNAFENTIDPLEALPQIDFASLPNELSSSDGFADSSIALYDEIMKKGWDFKVYVKTKKAIDFTSIPVGTILEMLSKKGELVEIEIDGRSVICNDKDLDHIFQETMKTETLIHEKLIPIGIARKNRVDKILGDFGKSYRETLFYVGQNFGLNFILFCAEDIDFENRKVNGIVLRNGMPEEGLFNIPKIIENSYFLPIDVQDELRKISHLVRPKVNVSKRIVDKQLSEEGTYKDILIPTVQIKSLKDILNAVEEDRVIIKSSIGMAGKSVVAITKINDDCYSLVQMQEQLELSLEELRDFYNEFVYGKKYILQPFVKSVTKQGEPFDIRISVRRGGNGEFTYKHRARIGNQKGVVSNLAEGGYSQHIEAFLLKNYGEEGYKIIIEKLNKLGEEFPYYFNETFYPGVNLYDMGIDIGIIENGGDFELRMFELNLRSPGGEGASVYGFEEQIAQCQYFKYLHNQLLETPNIQFIWPIEPKYQPTLHDYYSNDFGIKKIGSLIHNNGKRRLKSASALTPEINSGFDIIAKPKTPVFAVASGKVIDVSEAGRSIVIHHDLTYEGKKVYTKYMNLSKISVKIGDVVSQEHVVGESGGNIGRTRIPKLHFRVMVSANAPSFTVDPLKVLPMRDFSKFDEKLLLEDGFLTSSVLLYESMLEKEWDFSVFAKTRVEIGGVSEGTVVEVISRDEDKMRIRHSEEGIELEWVCKYGDLRYNF